MTEKDKILQVLYQFIHTGLIAQDIERLVALICERVLGIGIGEQGFVTSQNDIRAVLIAGAREDEEGVSHQVRYGRTEVLQHSDSFATICAEIIVVTQRQGDQRVVESNFMQLLTVQKEEGRWKICALHASTPVISEESAEAYPLKIAEKTLQSLKKRIGDQVYAAEEQYRQAILADTIAFYIVNLTKNRFEKSQCNGDLCATVDEGESYQQLVENKLPLYVHPQDKRLFLQKFSLESLRHEFERGEKEVSCEYRILTKNGDEVWALSVARLIFDQENNDHKAILYVRNIDQRKREELSLQRQATCDSMTGLYNKATFQQMVTARRNERRETACGMFVMLDIDHFKDINDNFGHPIGDEVLVSVAGFLVGAFGENSVVARLGGDEFGVFAPDATDASKMLDQLEHLRLQVEQLRLESTADLRATCSIGAVCCTPQESFDEIYTNADSALYASKHHGRNRVTLHSRMTATEISFPKGDASI